MNAKRSNVVEVSSCAPLLASEAFPPLSSNHQIHFRIFSSVNHPLSQLPSRVKTSTEIERCSFGITCQNNSSLFIGNFPTEARLRLVVMVTYCVIRAKSVLQRKDPGNEVVLQTVHLTNQKQANQTSVQSESMSVSKGKFSPNTPETFELLLEAKLDENFRVKKRRKLSNTPIK